MVFSARWGGIGIGNNYAGILVDGDPADFLIVWGGGARDRYRGFNRDFSGNDGVNDTLYAEHDYPTDGSYIVTIKHLVEATPTIRLFAHLNANGTAPMQGPVSNLPDLVVATRFADKFHLAVGDDIATGGEGNDSIDGGVGNDVIFGGLDDDVLYGRAGQDYLQGDEGRDLLIGYDGNDRLIGNSGNDTLRGNEGFDYLEGGRGLDYLTGGADGDTFIFGPAREPWEDPSTPPLDDPDRDIITDYQQGLDRIDVSGWGAMTFIGDTQFSGNGPELQAINRGLGTTVSGDVDGDRFVDFTFYIRNTVILTTDDFIFANGMM